KTIRDVVAATNGLNTDRGDQLIVESLPFESSRNFEPPFEGPGPVPGAAPVPFGKTQLIEQFQKNRMLSGIVAVAVALLLFILRMLGRVLFRKSAPRPSSPAELPAGANAESPGLLPTTTLAPAGAFASGD